MFIEVNSATTDRKLLINLGTINIIRSKGDGAELEISEGVYYEVRESYEQIKQLIINSRSRLSI